MRRALIWLTAGLGLPAVILGLAWLLAVSVLAPLNKPSTVSEPAVAAPEVRRAPTARVAVPPVKVYAGDTKARLKLPADALADPALHVTSAVRVPANERPSTVTTTINSETGDTRAFVKSDPYPWFAIETRGEVRLSLGAKMERGRIEQIVRLGASYDVVRVKALTAGIAGTVDSDGTAFLGVGVAYRW